MELPMNNIDSYVQLLQIATALGSGLVAVIKGYAQRDLTPEEYAELQVKWDSLVDRTARNAGLPPSH